MKGSNALLSKCVLMPCCFLHVSKLGNVHIFGAKIAFFYVNESHCKRKKKA